MFHTKKVAPFKTKNIPSYKSVTPLKYYSDLAFRWNVFSDVTQILDYTMRIAQVHLKGKDKYEFHDDIVVYYFLLFNALIPHCILSWCKQTYNIYCMSIYLKSAIVGMNNNLMPLTTKQAILSAKPMAYFEVNE